MADLDGCTAFITVVERYVLYITRALWGGGRIKKDIKENLVLSRYI